MPNANRDKGLKAERDVVGYLLSNGAPTTVRRSAETGTAQHQDTGDIRGLPGVCIQVKNTPSRTMVDGYLAECMADVERQRAAAGASIGVMIEKRAGKANPGEWWLWAKLSTINAVRDISCIPPYVADRGPVIRMQLQGLVKSMILFSASPDRWHPRLVPYVRIDGSA